MSPRQHARPAQGMRARGPAVEHPRRRSSNAARRHDILLYLVLAYVLSWSVWPLVLLNPDSSPLVPFGPGLAAVVVALAGGGRAGLADLVRQLGHWRVSARWYGVAIGIPLAVPALALGAALVTGAPAPHWERSDVLPVAGTLVVTVVVVGLFEELGWRGFLLPRLQRRHSALAAALIVGLVWLPWHLPELVSDPGQRPLVPFAISVIAQSVLLTWLYNSTSASLPAVILFHATFNTFAQFFLADLVGTPKLVAWWTLTVLLAVLALSLVHHMGGSTMERRSGAAHYSASRTVAG